MPPPSASLRSRFAAFARQHAHALALVESVVHTAAWLAPEGDAADFLLEGGASLRGAHAARRDADAARRARPASCAQRPRSWASWAC